MNNIATMNSIIGLSTLVLIASASLRKVEDSSQNTRIIGGHKAYPGQFSFVVFLMIDETQFCGGSIIAVEWILTAAHCTFEKSNFTVAAGTINPFIYAHQKRNVSKVIIHDSYDPKFYKNDISLIKLSGPLKYGLFVQPIPLISRLEEKLVLEGSFVLASGWGKTSDDSVGSSYLQFVPLKIINHKFCSYQYKKGFIHDGNFCTSTQKGIKGPCHGDSGGPLITMSRKLVGITSFGDINGCQTDLPSVFVRVSHYLKWIYSNRRTH